MNGYNLSVDFVKEGSGGLNYRASVLITTTHQAVCWRDCSSNACKSNGQQSSATSVSDRSEFWCMGSKLVLQIHILDAHAFYMLLPWFLPDSLVARSQSPVKKNDPYLLHKIRYSYVNTVLTRTRFCVRHHGTIRTSLIHIMLPFLTYFHDGHSGKIVWLSVSGHTFSLTFHQIQGHGGCNLTGTEVLAVDHTSFLGVHVYVSKYVGFVDVIWNIYMYKSGDLGFRYLPIYFLYYSVVERG